jgi:hypothetical protein
MNVCIVTLLNTNNCGSYWQARALGIAIEKLGHSVSYYTFNYLPEYRIADYKAIFGMFAVQGFSEAVKYINSLRSFSRLRKDLSFERNQNNIDCVVLGSDTIWNLGSKNLNANFAILWGTVFSGKKIITYAGSVANAKKELFIDERIQEAVNRWNAISVRDEYTRSIISNCTNKPVEMVCDPTLLFDQEDYDNMLADNMLTDTVKDNFIFLYLFKDLSDAQTNELQRFALANDLRIIQGVNGKKLKASDYSVENSPLLFLKHMIGAKYVVTDTFHGTIFSINLNKQFVSIDREKNKVNEAIHSLGFDDRLIRDDKPFLSKLTSSIHYDERMKQVNDLRKFSWSYLKRTLQ